MENQTGAPICLIVEDNEFAADLIGTFLETRGIFSDKARNGKIGLALYLENPSRYSVILADIQMPEMDGFEMSRLIRESGAANAASIPIIAMSGNNFDTQEGLRFMNRFIQKPYDYQVLFEAVKEEMVP